MTPFGIFASVLVLYCAIEVTSACNGYTLKVNHIKNCGDDDVVKIKDFNVEMDADCNIIPTGCLYTKGFATAVGTYKIVKAPLPPIEGELDMCEAVQQSSDLLGPMMEALDFPVKECPAPEVTVCGDGKKKIDISQYKNKLGMAAGKVSIQLNVKHDTGTTCADISVEISKPGGKKRG